MTTYREIIQQVQQLTPEEQLRLLEEVAGLVRQQTISQPNHNILELEGLGKELWQVIDAQAYVNQERDSWQQQTQHPLSQVFAELRQICEEENYTLEVPARSDRPNPFS